MHPRRSPNTRLSRCALRTAIIVCSLCASVGTIRAQSPEELKRLSLEDLTGIEVTSVAKIPETVWETPAAVYVITQEDIRRSGATSIPEVLRLAPGLQVARLGAGTWAIGIRGFADRLARSILVMIDGRPVYSPLFAGTYWESQDTLLADIDRIEIIRGPGGTLWGANAVNGIINIITKAATDTQGVLLEAGGGSEQRGFGSIRYGGTSGSASYRAYFKGFDRRPEFHTDGNNYDGWRAGQVGARADWTLGHQRIFTLEGDAYDGRLGERPSVASYTSPFTQATNIDAPISGGNVLARFAGGGVQFQAYYDRTNRSEIPVSEDRDTADVDFQQTLRVRSRNSVTWGAGYRLTSGRITAVAPTAFTPSSRTDRLYSAFLQDEIVLAPNRWRAAIGAKFEHNDYSGFEVQPSARLLWTPGATHTVWAGVTRAVRTPSRVETDYTTFSLAGTSPIPTFVRLLPNQGFIPETLVAYEVGYRARPKQRVYVTASAFYNDLQNTLSTELLPPFIETTPAPPHLILPVDFANGLHGNSEGIEITGETRPAPWLRLTSNYSYVFVSMSKNAGSHDVSQETHYEGAIPHHQVQVGSSVDLSRWSFDWMVRRISALPASLVPAYTSSDIRAAWSPTPRLDLSLVGQNLFDDHHLEWPSGTGTNVEIARSVYARVTWRR
jgi:iron complex outermembrane recepter protein